MSALSILVVNLVHKGEEDFIAAELTKLMPFNLAEAGLVSYELLRDPTDPCRFVHVEKWASRAAFDAHVASDHVKAWQAASECKIAHSQVYLLDRFL